MRAELRRRREWERVQAGPRSRSTAAGAGRGQLRCVRSRESPLVTLFHERAQVEDHALVARPLLLSFSSRATKSNSPLSTLSTTEGAEVSLRATLRPA